MLVTGILGKATDAGIAEALHALGHAGGIEYVFLESSETLRHRLRVTTDRGTDCAILLPRNVALENGSVLMLEPDRAIVVRLVEEQWLRVQPIDQAAALETGYHAGNHHWRVRFAGNDILIAIEGPREDYLERLFPLLESRRARIVAND